MAQRYDTLRLLMGRLQKDKNASIKRESTND